MNHKLKCAIFTTSENQSNNCSFFQFSFQIVFAVSCMVVASQADKQNVKPSPRQLKQAAVAPSRFPRFRFGGKQLQQQPSLLRKVQKPLNRNAGRPLPAKQLKKSRAVPNFPKFWQSRAGNGNAKFVK
jgi:hypothetical protein